MNIFGNKLHQIVLVLVAMILVAITFVSKSYYDNYLLAKQEILGLEEVKNILPVLSEIQKYRGYEQLLLSDEGENKKENLRQIAEFRNNTISRIQDYTPKSRKDTFEVHRIFRQIAEQLKNHSYKDFHSGLDHFHYHSQQIDLILAQIQEIHYKSNLMLDSEHKSYYLSSIGVSRMSALIENLAKIRGLTTGYLARSSADQRYADFVQQEIILLKHNIEEIGLRLNYLEKDKGDNLSAFSESLKENFKQIETYSFLIEKILNQAENTVSAENIFSQATAIITEVQGFQLKIIEKDMNVIGQRASDILYKALFFGIIMASGIIIWLWAIRFYILQNKKSSRLLQAITEGRQHLIYASEPAEIYMNLSKILAEHGKYIAVGIFVMKHNAARDLQPVAIYGQASGYFDNLDVSWGDNKKGQGPFGLAIRSGQPQIFNDILTEPAFSPWREKARGFGIRSSAAISLELNGQAIGAIGLYSNKKNSFISEEIEIIKNLMDDSMFNIAAIQTRKERDIAMKKLHSHNAVLKKKVILKSKNLMDTQEAMIFSLASLVESRDNETGNHIIRTREYIRVLLNLLKKTTHYSRELTSEKVEEIYKAAPLHDIGKIAVSDAILRKPGKLTEAEFDLMKKHTIIGATAISKAGGKIKSNSFLRTAREIILHHHEKWNGSGYPMGLKENQIPLSARIMTVADVYDALISDRVYKKAFSHSEAIDIIEKNSGKDFDPLVVNAFLQSANEFHKIAKKYRD